MTSRQFDYSKLRGRIVEMYGSVSKLIQQTPVTEVAFRHKLCNQNAFRADEIAELCDLLKIPKKEIPAYFFTEKE